MPRPRHLLNIDGSCFEDLAAITRALAALDNADRTRYRNENADAIAQCDSRRLLIVAGPGSGKSRLFLARIRYWLARTTDEKIYVATFVRKLVSDLRADLRSKLDDTDRQRVAVTTLHTLARSLVERNAGTKRWPMQRYIRVIDRQWADVTWADVLAFHPDLSPLVYTLRAVEDQLHTDLPDSSPDWVAVRATYRRLCQFYNAAGFAYLIRFAREAVEERPALADYQFWIADEYQDFNACEDRLIAALTEPADGVLLAGDDEQALYQTLKASTPDIIIGHYGNPAFAKAMLPFCSRCGFYIARAASTFMGLHRVGSAIAKVYLPIAVDLRAPRVRVVAAATPTTAVDYVRTFIEGHREQYEAYLEGRGSGEISDPFLLILSQSGNLTLSGTSAADKELHDLVDGFAEDSSSRSVDYRRVMSYLAAGRHEDDNFSVRKVLDYEDFTVAEVHDLIVMAIDQTVNLVVVVAERHPDVIAKVRAIEAALHKPVADLAHAVAEVGSHVVLTDLPALAAEFEAYPPGADPRYQEDEEAIETAGAVPPVALMTMAGSKGLSAHHVIVLGCDDVNMSYTTPLTFFVALTRARESLHLIVAAKAGGSKGPHRFLFDLPADCCDYIAFRKTGRVVEPLTDVADLVQRFAVWAKFAAKRSS